tara:strand:+ start:2521 stop:2772 length:252 start_codon:yes stop_codon:yes gene_type:complete
MISHADHKAYLESCETYCRANYSEAEMMTRLRIARDYFLQATDVYAISDRTISTEMKTYRQALRDLPATVGDVYLPVFPTPPS